MTTASPWTSAVVFLIHVVHVRSACYINLEKKVPGLIPPLLVKDGQFFYPEHHEVNLDRIQKVDYRSSIDVVCHGSDGDTANQIKGTSLSRLTLKCSTLERFRGSDGIYYKVEEMGCTQSQKPTIVKRKEVCAPEGADGRTEDLEPWLHLVQIGWNLTLDHFHEQIRLCLDEYMYATLWTRHLVHGPSIELRDITVSRPSFKKQLTDQVPFFKDIPSTSLLNRAYSKSSQALVIEKILGNNRSPLGGLIVDDSSSSNYFARGHLSPDADFIFDAEQDATYFFINVAPQFQSFNNGNWKALEGSVRTYAATHKEDVIVYTGTYGYLQYQNNDKAYKSIYLYLDDKGNSFIPAPWYYWKVVHNQKTNQAIAFVGINDPHEVAPPPLLCENQCDRLSWVDWDVTKISSGYMYCCEVQDLRKNIQILPDLSGPDGTWPELMADQEPEKPLPPGTCIINFDDRQTSRPPLLMINGDFLFPEKNNDQKQSEGYAYDQDNVKVVCHGTMKKPSYVQDFGINPVINLQCQSGKFYRSDKEVNIHNLTCTAPLEPFIIKTPDNQCASEGADGRKIGADRLNLVQIGWHIEGKFHEQIRLCQDHNSYITLWTHHVLVGRGINQRDTGGYRPSFTADIPGYSRFFTRFPKVGDISESYSKSSQVDQAITLFGHNKAPEGGALIEDTSSGTNYFAKGHLSPDAAFVYDAFQDATYLFLNAAPQFQSFNNGNWRYLEAHARIYADSTRQDIDVYTGTYGLLSYKDTAGKSSRFYLYTEAGNQFLPAPKYFWKVLHNRQTNQAIAFVGLNDPHRTSAPGKVCKNVCDRLSWVDWPIDHIPSGYMYCCEVEDLKSYVDYVPDLRDDNGNWPDLLADK